MKLQRSVLGIMAVLCLTLCGCKGRPLPDGMEEAALLGAGQEVVLLMAGGDYTSVYDALREDVAAGTSVEEIALLMEQAAGNAGEYRQITDRMTTGQSSNGEEYGVAVFYCEFSKDSVLFRTAFDVNLELIGLEVKKQ